MNVNDAILAAGISAAVGAAVHYGYYGIAAGVAMWITIVLLNHA